MMNPMVLGKNFMKTVKSLLKSITKWACERENGNGGMKLVG